MEICNALRQCFKDLNTRNAIFVAIPAAFESYIAHGRASSFLRPRPRLCGNGVLPIGMGGLCPRPRRQARSGSHGRIVMGICWAGIRVRAVIPCRKKRVLERTSFRRRLTSRGPRPRKRVVGVVHRSVRGRFRLKRAVRRKLTAKGGRRSDPFAAGKCERDNSSVWGRERR